MDVATLRRFKELREKKTALELELKEINEELDRYADIITNEFATEGIDSMKIDGKNIVPSSMIWAKVEPGKKEEAKAILESMGLDDMVGFNFQRLSAYVREIIKSGDNLPKEFEGVIGYYEKISLRLHG